MGHNKIVQMLQDVGMEGMKLVSILAAMMPCNMCILLSAFLTFLLNGFTLLLPHAIIHQFCCMDRYILFLYYYPYILQYFNENM